MADTKQSAWVDPAQTKYRGITISMGGQDWIVPSLSVKQFRENYQTLVEGREVTDDKVLEIMDKCMPILVQAFQRNYPGMTVAELEDLVDLMNFREVMMAISGRSTLAKAGDPSSGK
jgi:hypothetical protein